MTETPKEPEYIITNKQIEEFGDYVEDDDNHTEAKYKNARGLAGKIRSRPLPEHDKQVRECVAILEKLESKLLEKKESLECGQISDLARGEIVGILDALILLDELRQGDKIC